MKSSHRFPLRRQIVWSTRIFTALTSLAVCAALFFTFQPYVRTTPCRRQSSTCGW